VAPSVGVSSSATEPIPGAPPAARARDPVAPAGPPRMPAALIAARDGVTDRAVRYRVERGVGKLAAWLNGRDYIDGYDVMGEAA
jgi:hypothetical protein